MAKWIEIRKSGDFAEIGKQHGISPVLARILKNRGVETAEQIEKYLNGGYEDLYSPYLLKDVKKGAAIIKQAIENGEAIRVIGDYDIDGVQSTYILSEGIARCGGNVDYAVPHRIEDGYGLNISLVERSIEAGITTIITCDNGIAARDAVSYAKEHGVKVVITDHHEIPYREENGSRTYLLPPADAIVNPKQPNCGYPFKGLCGAAVAYKFIMVLYDLFGISEAESKRFIENAGFATIGDVMDLTDENRILVKLGLTALRATQNPGMQCLIELNNLDYLTISSYHVGFILGPCINATGRLDTAEHAVQLLKESDKDKAMVLAKQLFTLNAERKDMTAEGVEAAAAQIEAQGLEKDKVLVIYLPECHESIAGIIAGKIRERYYRPVFVVTDTREGVKGSGRSIEGYAMYDELVKVSHLLTKFGGHLMAAGISLEKENLDLFRRELNHNCTLKEEDLIEKIKFDAVLPLPFVSKDLVIELEKLEPCGKGNAKPVFAERSIAVSGMRVLGQNKNAVKLKLKNTQSQIDTAMYFTDGERFETFLREKFGDIETDALLNGNAQHTFLHMLYYPTLNEWNGRTTLQITAKEMC